MNIDNIIASTYEELSNIDNIGSVIANSVYNYFKDIKDDQNGRHK